MDSKYPRSRVTGLQHRRILPLDEIRDGIARIAEERGLGVAEAEAYLLSLGIRRVASNMDFMRKRRARAAANRAAMGSADVG